MKQAFSKVVAWLEAAYCWFWFHTEFWLTPVDRRPFTFMMRDFWAQHIWVGTAIFLVVTGLIVWGCIWSRWFIPLALFHGALLAHLWWGTPYIENEQEVPAYLG